MSKGYFLPFFLLFFLSSFFLSFFFAMVPSFRQHPHRMRVRPSVVNEGLTLKATPC